MKWKFDAYVLVALYYVLWPFAQRFQNRIIDRSTADNFTVCHGNYPSWICIWARTTDTRWINPKFFAAQIYIPIPNKYLAIGCKGLFFCQLFENLFCGFTVKILIDYLFLWTGPFKTLPFSQWFLLLILLSWLLN